MNKYVGELVEGLLIFLLLLFTGVWGFSWLCYSSHLMDEEKFEQIRKGKFRWTITAEEERRP